MSLLRPMVSYEAVRHYGLAFDGQIDFGLGVIAQKISQGVMLCDLLEGRKQYCATDGSGCGHLALQVRNRTQE
ncbi:MAG: hypothetical protein JNK57_05020 [Planctomycetaceae bacterium]|nr:hypothetical protein [Planctomycetaceae bacterium]